MLNTAYKNIKNIKQEFYSFIFKILAPVLILKLFFFSNYLVVSESMSPTLIIGDFVLGTKWNFGYGSRSIFGKYFKLWDGKILCSQPARGDIIVFYRSSSISASDTKLYVKRVVGIPGDKIYVKDRILYINDIPCKAEEISDTVKYELPAYVDQDNMDIYWEDLPDKTHYAMYDKDSRHDSQNNTKHFIVPEGRCFVIGDYRDNSGDSRGYMGFVEHDDIIAKAIMIYSSFDKSPSIFKAPIEWLYSFYSNIRLARFFKSLS